MSHNCAENGEATVEFLALVVAIIVPLAYFIFTLATVQATIFASEAAARESARILAHDHTRTAFAQRQVDQIFTDYQAGSPRNLAITCDPAPCNGTSTVHVQVDATVDLPLMPDRWAGALSPIPIRVHVAMPTHRVHLEP
ncbi:MAG: hypothetical protein Q4P05_06785 [Actinomycetaceae bacterium]|nr:hypothetical protein [Actinomycetaceae bacterium]